ncbi:MAG: phosphatase PAP2 family protein [Deltaproteobacteria bacterium]|nr:phosphatase PAP2 family protein [Deltaproteobacteria bacterium]
MFVAAFAVCLVLSAAFVGTGAEAAEPSPYSVVYDVDIPITVFGAVVAVSPSLVGDLPGPSCAPSCDPSTLNALDRTVIGNRSSGARLASDILLNTAITLPFGLDALDVGFSGPPDGWRGYGADATVMLEALSLNYALFTTVKYAALRPRPYVYDKAVGQWTKSSTNATLSFYSGHASTSFCMAAAYGYTFMKRHPGSNLVVPVWIAGEALAAAVAYLRVHSGMHFWTDVLAGAAAGTAVGLLVPWAHDRGSDDGVGSSVSSLRAAPPPRATGTAFSFSFLW